VMVLTAAPRGLVTALDAIRKRRETEEGASGKQAASAAEPAPSADAAPAPEAAPAPAAQSAPASEAAPAEPAAVPAADAPAEPKPNA
jgi:hypothetical protein